MGRLATESRGSRGPLRRYSGEVVIGWIQEGVKVGFLAGHGEFVCVVRGCYVCGGRVEDRPRSPSAGEAVGRMEIWSWLLDCLGSL